MGPSAPNKSRAESASLHLKKAADRHLYLEEAYLLEAVHARLHVGLGFAHAKVQMIFAFHPSVALCHPQVLHHLPTMTWLRVYHAYIEIRDAYYEQGI